MRLINADTLIKNLSYLYTKNHIPVDMRAKEILTTIMEQPTAYDVDKVIEELKDAKYDVCLFDDDLEYYQRGIDKAIKIVKQGGKKIKVVE